MSLTMNTFYSFRVLQWALCFHQPMQTLAWVTMKKNLQSYWIELQPWHQAMLCGKLKKIPRWHRNTFQHRCYKNRWPVNNTSFRKLWHSILNETKWQQAPFSWHSHNKIRQKSLDKHLFKTNRFKTLCILPF